MADAVLRNEARAPPPPSAPTTPTGSADYSRLSDETIFYRFWLNREQSERDFGRFTVLPRLVNIECLLARR